MKKTFLLIAALLMMGSAAFAGGGFDIALGRPWEITEDGKVSLHGARLDFGGFAKGYALSR